MTIQKVKRGNFGFTLLEVLVIFGIIVVLVGLATSILARVKQTSKSVVCLNNLKQIAAAIQMYHADHKAMPNRLYPLLKDTGYLASTKIFKCPADLSTDADSYGPFYLPRQLTDAQKLFLGCPRHSDKAIALFGWPQFNIARTCKVLWNGTPVSQGTVVTGGTLLFEDGTTAVIDSSLPVGVMLSTLDSNKHVYSAISVQDGDLGNGTITVTHTDPTSQFDVLTPSLITGVAGTAFTVTVKWPDTSISGSVPYCSTKIVVTSGKVLAEELTTAGKINSVEVKNGVAGTLTAKSPITISPTATTPPGTPYPPSKPWWWWWWKWFNK